MAELTGEHKPPTSIFSEGSRWGGSILTGMISLAIIMGLVMVAVFSYEKGNESAISPVIPVISAREGPTKIKPEMPGGMAIDHQDKNVYNRIDPTTKKERVEKLLPAPEPVMSKPTPTKPKRIKKNDSPKTPKNMTKNSVTSILPTSKPVSEAKRAGGQKITKKVGKNLNSDTKGSPMTVYRVQFASLKTKKGADAAWKKLQIKHPSLLGNLKPKIVRTLITGKGTYYRLQAGTFNNSKAARKLCIKAKKRKLGCFIVKHR